MKASRILVRATNWVGDAVMSLPALQALRQHFPEAKISVLARPWVADLYARENFADEVIPYNAARGWADLRGKYATVRRIREGRFDAAILLQNAFEAAALVALARVPIRIGYDRDGRGFLLTHAIPVPRSGEIPEHQRFYYLELLRRAGILASTPDCPAIRLSSASAAAEQGRRRFAQLGWSDVTGVSPGAAFGGAKRWLPDRFASAAMELGWPVAIFGSVEERELCGVVLTEMQRHGWPAYNFAGETTLCEYIDLAAACRVYLTNDSGPMHIASALGVPTVAVFGATDHVATGPTGPLARIVRQPVECSPCLLRECPIDHRCMTRVKADAVAEAARQALATARYPD
ncbi:MAG TPA: lipopolysaccharide heptosyltransferase II [Bryobacteraceae bacterium]|nr:lipopolysaccharide heptosyltransferase II [Bryobacteraceae bacterium]